MKQTNDLPGFLDDKFNFDFFITLTTERELTLKSARRAITRFHNELHVTYTPALTFWSAEQFQLMRSDYHLHMIFSSEMWDKDIEGEKRIQGLLRMDGAELYKEFRSIWMKCTGSNDIPGQRSRVDIRKFNAEMNGTKYVAKYINKKAAIGTYLQVIKWIFRREFKDTNRLKMDYRKKGLNYMRIRNGLESIGGDQKKRISGIAPH